MSKIGLWSLGGMCLLSGLLLAPAAYADEDRADPFAGSSISKDRDASTDGSFFGLFGSEGTELSEFERPTEGYGQITARRPGAIRLQNARGSGLISEPETEDYLNGILRKILAANGLGDLAPRVYLHADTAAHALATPDGAIILNIGLVQALRTEGEIAFLLAHEVSHFLLQHHSSDWFVETESRMLTGVETLRTIGNGLAEKVGETDSAMSKKLKRANQIGAIIYDISDNVMFSAWGREQEEEADHLGLDLMVGAGYYPFDAEGVMEVMAAHEARVELNREGSKTLMKTRSAEAFGLSDEDISSNPILAGIAGGLGEMIAAISSDHYPAEERAEEIFEYSEKHYSDAVPGLKVAAPWVASDDHPVNRIMRAYDAANEALSALGEGDLRRAEQLARKSVTGITSSHAFPRVVFQKVRRAQKQHSKAEQNLQLAQRSDVVPMLVYFEYIDLENEKRAYDGILDIVAKAEGDAGGEIPQFIPYAVFAYRALGDHARAFDTQKSCEIERPEMQRSCKMAGQGEYPGTPPVTRKQKPGKRPGTGLGQFNKLR